jgi:LysR family transcriptional regulator, transcriptional activator of the cysJI operon
MFELKLNVNQLLIFFCVAKEKNMTSAAHELCLTEPTISYHIKSLEEACRMKLMDTHKKRITLTSNGEVLYHHCKQLYNQAMVVQRFVDLTYDAGINVGVSPGLISFITSTVHMMSSRIGSSFKVQLDIRVRDALIKDVIDSKLDIAIVADLDCPNDELSRVRISDGEKLIFYASPDHPVFQKKQIEWQDICHFTLILGNASYFVKKMIVDKLIKEGIYTPLKINMTPNNVECCKKLARDKEGISIAFIEDIEDEIKSGSLKIVPLPEDFQITIDAVFNKGFNTSPLIQQFIDCAKTVLHNRDNRVSNTTIKCQ